MPKLKGKKEIKKELADVIAVVNEIKKVFKISDREIKKELEIAHEKKGGFKKKLYLYWSSNTGYKTNETRNSKPEIQN